MEENRLVMRKPEEIRNDIAQLEKELKKSEDHYKWEWLVGSDEPGEKIGFFNITKAKIILNELHSGNRLQLRHDALGTFDVYMNPQRNRILVDAESESVDENSIMSFIVWHSGDWYKNRK